MAYHSEGHVQLVELLLERPANEALAKAVSRSHREAHIVLSNSVAEGAEAAAVRLREHRRRVGHASEGGDASERRPTGQSVA